MKIRSCLFVGVFGLIAASTQTGRAGTAPAGVWASIYSTDISTYADNLRKAGAPESTVGVLVSQEINSAFKAREEALVPSLSSLQTLKEGWSTQNREALVQLRREKNELLRAVLGAVPVETAKITKIPDSLADATVEQREMVRLVMEDYAAMQARVYTESRGFLLEEDKEKLRFLENEVAADLAKILKPEQALDYQIERDGYMHFLRQRLELFQPTAQEMRDIYLVRKEIGLDIESRSPSPSNHLIDLQKLMGDKLTARWGEARFAEYRRTSSRQYQQIYHLVRRMGLPLKNADEIYDSLVATSDGAYQKMLAMRGTRFVSTNGERPTTPGDVAKTLMAEHCALVKRLLGEDGYQEYYKLNSRVIDAMNKGGIFRVEVSIY
jgi:hypothetical protein